MIIHLYSFIFYNSDIFLYQYIIICFFFLKIYLFYIISIQIFLDLGLIFYYSIFFYIFEKCYYSKIILIFNMCSCLTWDGAASLLKGMGGSLTCRRRSRAEPFEEPEPVAPVDSSPGSSSFHSEADSDHHLEVAGTSQVEDHPVVEERIPLCPSRSSYLSG